MKSNTNGKLAPFHQAAIIALTTISPEWKHPQTALFTLGTVLKKARIPEDAHVVADAFSETMDRLHLENLDPLNDIHASIRTQMRMIEHDAAACFAPFHDVLIAEIAGLFPTKETAVGAKFRALLLLMDIAIIPGSAIPALYAVAQQKAAELGLVQKDWFIGPMTGLYRRLPEEAQSTIASTAGVSQETSKVTSVAAD